MIVSEEENYNFAEEDNTVHEERLLYKRKFIVKLRTEFNCMVNMVKLLYIIFYCTILFSTSSFYYIKLKSRLSVRLRHGIISVVSAWIDL